MLLSIGMMVKNEEKYLDKCLSALTPILENLDSELIIVDTGSTDKTVEIAKKYTDKVYFHNWNNNFSEMRNVTLSYCSGEWFFYVDGDEILESCDDIINFFNNFSYENYNSSTIYIKNISSLEDETSFSIFPALRLFKKDHDFKFVNAVHNQPLYKEPIKVLPTNCKHYGYISTDEELMERKFKRTTTILKNEIEKDPDNIYYLFQLSVSYGMHKEYDEAVLYIQKAYDTIWQKQKNINKFIYVFPQLCLSYFSIQDYLSVEKYAKECLKYNNTLIDVFYCVGISSMILKKNKDSIDYLQRYLELYKNYYKSDKNMSITDYTLGRINEVYYSLYLLYRESKDYEQAKMYLLKITDDQHNLSGHMVDLCIKTKSYAEIKKYEEKLFLLGNSKEIRKLYNELEKKKINLDKEETLLLTKLFSNGNTTYNLLNQIRLKFINQEVIKVNLIYELLDEIELVNQPFYFSDLIYYLMLNHCDISNALINFRFNKINEYLEYLSSKYEDLNEVVYEYICGFIDNGEFSRIRINKELVRYLILLNKLEKDKLFNIYNIYVQAGISYVNYIYSNFVLENERCQDVRTEEEMFFVYMNKAKYYKENNKKLYIHYLRKALDVYPYMKDVVEFLLDQEKKVLENKNAEFEKHKIKIKNIIKTLIDNGELKTAEKVIKEYETIVSNDLEILLFKSQMLTMAPKLEK